MRKTARPVVWEGVGAKSPALHPIVHGNVPIPIHLTRFQLLGSKRIHRCIRGLDAVMDSGVSFSPEAQGFSQLQQARSELVAGVPSFAREQRPG